MPQSIAMATVNRTPQLLALLAAVSLSLISEHHALRDRPVPRLLMGTKSSNLTATLVYNPHPLEAMKPHRVSLHFVIPTIGRKSIFRMLESLEPQLESQDHVTIVFDAVDREQVYKDVKDKLAEMPGFNKAVMHSENTRDFGHSLRGSHQSTTGDFVLFADDDNWYEADAVQTVRTVVEHDFDALYVFQMRYQDDGRVLPDFKEHYEVELYNIDTGCGVVPVKHVHLSNWSQGGYNADAHFYTTISNQLPRTYFIPKVIYAYSGVHFGHVDINSAAQN